MPDDNIHILDVQTKLPLPVNRILDGARNAELSTAIVVGYTEDGEEYFASSTGDIGTIIVLLERMRLGILTDKFGSLEPLL